MCCDPICSRRLTFGRNSHTGFFHLPSRSTIGGGRGCHKFVAVFGGDGTKIPSPGDLFDQHPGEMSGIRGKFADHIGHHIVLSPEGVVLATSTGTESSYHRPPQSLEYSSFCGACLNLFSREKFSRPFPSSIVKSNFVYPRINRPPLAS